MEITGINRNKCIHCLECVKECPERLFAEYSTEEIVFSDPLDKCIECGHCIAVCPSDAVDYRSMERSLDLRELHDYIPPYDDFQLFVRSRRSIRRFKNKPVDDQLIKKVLGSMRYAPTASNSQEISYVVLKDKEELRKLTGFVMGLFRKLFVLLKFRKILGIFRGSNTGGLLSDGTYDSLKSVLEGFKSGEDRILFNAPCAFILCSPDKGSQAGIDAGIALAHGMLAAQTLGLGTCAVGFAHETLLFDRKARKEFGIPKGMKPRSVMVLGYPDVKFHYAPVRNDLNII